MEKHITVRDREEIAQLVGVYDQNLKLIRRTTGVDILVRDNKIKVRGERKGLDRATRAIVQLQEHIREHGSISPADVEEALGISSSSRTAGPPSATPSSKVFRRDRAVEPKSAGQAAYLKAIDAFQIVFSIGPAGTGKTFIAVAKAVEALKKGVVRRIVLVRPAVEAGESLGFLPGDIEAKVNPYLRPLYDALNHFLEFGQLRQLIGSDVIEIAPLAYMRGRTLDEAFVILDEAQNTTHEQMKMFLTRMGRQSKIVVTGDITQIDLPPGKVSGLVEVQDMLRDVDGIAFSYLTKEDIVRHPLVQKIVEAYDRRRKK